MTKCEKVQKGLEIICRYPTPEIAVTRDAIHAGPDSRSRIEISNDDQMALEALGWFYDEDEESWTIFV